MLRVTVVDITDGIESEPATAEVVPGDYLLIAHEPCHLDGSQQYPAKGTVILTIRDWHPVKPEAASS